MFVLHERLAADTSLLTDWRLCSVLLMNDANYPWLILVPKREGLRDFHDLTQSDWPLAMAEIDRASRALEAAFNPDKINVGALGNMVEQLHIHVIARFESDPAWPGPAWGAVPPQVYDDFEAASERIRQFVANQ